MITCSNSAPPIKTKFNSPTQLPYLLLEDNAAVASVCGADWQKTEWTKALLTDDDKIVFVHKDFQVREQPRWEVATWN